MITRFDINSEIALSNKIIYIGVITGVNDSLLLCSKNLIKMLSLARSCEYRQAHPQLALYWARAVQLYDHDLLK